MKFASVPRAGLAVSLSVPLFSLEFFDYRNSPREYFSLNNSDVRLDSDGSSGLALAIIVTMAIDITNQKYQAH